MFAIKNGELYIEEVRAAELAERFGTPLYVYSNAVLRSRFAEIRESFLEKYKGAFAAYAGKAFLTPSMCRIVEEEGFHLDVVSGGEFFTAMKAGFPAGRVSFHGNNKTYAELDMAIGAGIGRIVIDGLDELEMVEKISARYGRRQAVLFRITPEVSAGAHDHIQTGKRDSKFGIPMDEDILYPLIDRAVCSPDVIFRGLHFHIGSQLFDNAPHIEATEKALEVILKADRRHGDFVSELVVGGGFGICYTAEDERKPYAYFLDPIMRKVEEFCTKHKLVTPAVGIEPGRSIAGDAGVTLYTVGSIKQIPGGTKYVSIDGGMSDNIRPALYGAKYEAIIANKAADSALETVTVCGKLCETGDRIIDGAALAHAERGDILCVFATGAYGYSMSNNYNKIPKAAVVLVCGDRVEIMANRQSYESMTADEM